MGALLLLLSSILSSAAAQHDSFLAPVFKNGNVVFVGENHLIVEHKLHFQKFIEELTLAGSLTKTAIAIELVQRDDSKTLAQYLADPQALRDSTVELNYFERLHRRLSLANNQHYDELMRTLRSTYQTSGGELRICAINVAEIYGSFGGAAAVEKLARLKQLPRTLQLEIETVQGLSLNEISRTSLGWDREGTLAVGVADCAKDKDRTLVLIGANHGIKYPTAYPARSAAQFVKLISPSQTVASIKFLQPFDSPIAAELGADERYFSSGLSFPNLQLFRASELPDTIYQKMLGGGHSKQPVDPNYANLFDYFVFGPWVHTIN